MKISTARKPAAAPKKPAAKPKAKAKKAAPAAKKLGGYIAPRRPVSSGGEGASTTSTFTPAYTPVSSGGEGGGGGGYTYVPTYSTGVSYGGE